jgi:Protochlamydia outer membrane protein
MNKIFRLFGYAFAWMIFVQYCAAQDIEQKTQLSFSAGKQQQQNFNWSIAGNQNGESPNVLSELKWKDVSGTAYSASLQWNFWHRFAVMGSYNRVDVHSGSVNDMDYGADNRTQPVYTGNFSDNKGYTTSWLAGAGYVIFNNKLFSLIPYAGYSNSVQNLYIVDLSGQFPTLNSSYFTSWKGPFVKVTSSIKIWRALKFAGDITYIQANYNAHGDWNLIQEFQHPISYTHVADGYGLDANARLIYNITPHIAVYGSYGYYNWETGDGTDQLYLSTGEVDKTRLNWVYRDGYQITGGIILSM